MTNFLDLVGKLRAAKTNPPALGARVPSTGNGYTGSKQKVKLDKIPKRGKKGKHHA